MSATLPPPPPSRPPRSGRWGNLAQIVSALCLLVVAVTCGGLGVNFVKWQDSLRAETESIARLQDVLRANADNVAKLGERLRVDAELARTTAALTAFQTSVDDKKFEIDHGLSCVSFIELLSRKPNFDTFAPDAERRFSRTIYSKAVFDIENVNYGTKDVEHPITRELKNCVAPNAGQERIAFPDELSVIVFRERFDAQIDAVFHPRFQLVLNTLATALIEYQGLEAPARKLIDGEVADWVCNTPVRKLFLRKTESVAIRTKIAEGRFRSLDSYISANCPG